MAQSLVAVLLSGGIDSTALLAHYQTKGYTVEALHIRYGHPSALRELRAAQDVSSYYNVSLRVIDLSLPFSHRGDEVLCRNAVFVLAACASLLPNVTKVALGIHRGVPYYDCSPVFLHDVQRMIDGYFGGTVVVEAPFVQWSKAEVYAYCKALGIPIELTFSCERSNEPCGECPSCSDRRHFDAC